ncbi:sensor histidine kinase [Methanoplanus limicola]|uniref:histidine kinase n=1 Tax=Methanoplanus limicola DSM 2279 TaxID=937775 RepID=H1Z341_9EURY|nr:MASE3 domain-containing protein [Methanoplanus limicola]EHQ35581.1 multi-sensor signal transduction histidine kinase [Methanoplanus limicola DSM 2279]
MAGELNISLKFMHNKYDTTFFVTLILILTFFSLSSLYSYLLFHTITELFSIVIAAIIFVIAWNSRDYITNYYLLFLGIAFIFIGGIDFLHTLAYNGMNIFAGYGANLPTELWIASRYMQAGTLIAAPLLMHKKTNITHELIIYSLITVVLILSIFAGFFPDCYIEGEGLTSFKIYSEYLISVLLFLSIYLLFRKREYFERKIYRLIVLSIIFTILSEIAFTFYVSVYGFSNLIGHLFKITEFALIYYAIVDSGIRRPYETIFRSLSQKESEVRKERDMLDLYINVAGVIFLILDVKGFVKLVNPKGCEILGYDREEIVGKKWVDSFIPEGEKVGVNSVRISNISGTDKFIESYENAVVTKTGERRIILWHNRILKDGNGKIIGTLSSGEDITERIKYENQLSIEKERLNKAQEISHTGSWEYNIASGEIWGSDEGFRIYGYNPPEGNIFPIGDIEACIPEREKVHQALMDLIGSGKEYNLEFAVNPADGGPQKIIKSVAERIPDENGRIIKVSGALQDVTEQKAAEKALQQINKKLNLLSSITRHDILNQLTAIEGYLELIVELNEISAGTKSLEYLNNVISYVDIVEKQILFTGDYSNLGASSPRWQNVGFIIREISQINSFEKLNTVNDVENLEIFADPLFEKVIYNLFDNAVKYGEKITTISFSYEVKPDHTILICQDDGAGVHPDVKEKIFKRQYYQNTGFGLFLSGEILSITDISIKETGIYGEGARFEIYIPNGYFRISQ